MISSYKTHKISAVISINHVLFVSFKLSMIVLFSKGRYSDQLKNVEYTISHMNSYTTYVSSN